MIDLISITVNGIHDFNLRFFKIDRISNSVLFVLHFDNL